MDALAGGSGVDVVDTKTSGTDVDMLLEQLVRRWRGSHAVLSITLARSDAVDPPETIRYEGILDGPFTNDGPGVGLILGSRVILGDIAVEGPFVSFEPARTDHASSPILNESFAELHATEMPLIAEVDDRVAVWEVLLGEGRVAHCHLGARGPR
jgi:hypothetical protein